MKNRVILILFLVAIILIAVGWNGLINGWHLATGRGFIVPKESTIFQFHATVMNEGSGEWWVYGEDSNSYYYFTGDSVMPYIKYTKQMALTCESFDPLNYLTWCNR